MRFERIIDLSKIDLGGVVADRAGIEAVNPHRGEIVQLDVIVWHDELFDHAVAYKDVRHDEFWVSGHIPGTPLLPGVLMVEAGAQLASYAYYRRSGATWFAGFTRIEETSFRGQVSPGDRLLLLMKSLKYSPKRFVSLVQGLVEGELVFQSRISGVAMPKLGDRAGAGGGDDR